jgi:hypothetical protein
MNFNAINDRLAASEIAKTIYCGFEKGRFPCAGL